MLNLENFAISFARAVELFRTRPDSVGEQKAALRALVALTRLAGVTLRLGDRTLTVDGVTIPPTLPGIKSLAAQLDLHGIEEIRIVQNAAPAELLGLLRALGTNLAGMPDGDGVSERMRRLHSGTVSVVAVASAGRPHSVTAAFAAAGLEGDAVGSAALRAATEGATAPTELETAIAGLALSPDGGDAPQRIQTTARWIAMELEGGRTDAALRAVTELVRLEAALTAGPSREAFQAVIDHLLAPRALTAFAELVGVPAFREAAVLALRRGGPASVTVLAEAVATADSMAERRAYALALLRMPEGARHLARLVEHEAWHVARAAAELAGTFRLEEAVPALGRALEHPDDRVRQQAAVALAQIGTAGTVQHIREALRRGDPEVRALVAGTVRGRESGALAMPLVYAAEDELDANLQREFYLALARIGTPEALQALIKAAQPGGRFFRRRRVETRVAAIGGLRAVGGPAAVGALEGLRDDRNSEVRNAAREALAEFHE